MYGQMVMVDADSQVNYGNGGIMVILGSLLMFAFLLMLMFEGWKPMPREFSCPRCQKAITRQDSLEGCFNCGLPIDWYSSQEQG